MKIPHQNCRYYNWLLYRRLFSIFEKFKADLNGDIVDLGCGEMPYRDYFLQYAKSYTGIDWGETIHELKADIVADLNKPLKLGDATFDHAISISVMEHLMEPRTFLKEAHRILKKGGRLYLQVPWQWRVHEAP